MYLNTDRKVYPGGRYAAPDGLLSVFEERFGPFDEIDIYEDEDFQEFLYGLKDLQKVRFDIENFDCTGEEFGNPEICGYHKLDTGLEFIGFCAGGDWEIPVYGILYYNGKSLRGYIPTQGNTFNFDTHTAIGSESDCYPLPERLTKRYSKIPNWNENPSYGFIVSRGYGTMEDDLTDIKPEVNLILDDIRKRIEVR